MDIPDFESLQAQSEANLQEYRLAHGRDTHHDILEAALEHLPSDGRTNLMRDIVEAGGDPNRSRQLAAFFIDGVLKPSMPVAPQNMFVEQLLIYAFQCF